MDSLIFAILNILNIAVTLYVYAVLIRVVVLWIAPHSYHPLIQLLAKITDPGLRAVQRWVPPIAGLDFSPMILIFGIYFIKNTVIKFLANIFLG